MRKLALMPIRLLRRAWRSFFPARPVSPGFEQALRALGPGRIAVDCGANVGLYTELMARTDASVHAYEPDPIAFAALTRRVGHLPNVTLRELAVSDVNGASRLYMHVDRGRDPLKLSQSSSMMSGKSNIDAEDFVEIETIDVGDLIGELGPVDLLKMDIEGHEIAVLSRLLDTGFAHQVGRAFVEMHDRKNPSLAAASLALRARIAAERLPFDLDWH